MWQHFQLKDFFDIFLVALLLFYLFRLVKVSGMRPLFTGVMIFLLIWFLVSQVFHMELIGTILSQVMGVGLILLVILFQDEIRRFLMSLGSRKSLRFITKHFFKNTDEDDISHITAIVLACVNMSRNQTGALIAVQGDLDLDMYEKMGEIINADVSQRLIENIFFKNSPLHDGAMIIEGKKIKAAGCILPVSRTSDIPSRLRLGLRHRAGIALSQGTDAKVIIVSEERGKISLAHQGQLKIGISGDDLQRLLLEKNLEAF